MLVVDSPEVYNSLTCGTEIEVRHSLRGVESVECGVITAKEHFGPHAGAYKFRYAYQLADGQSRRIYPGFIINGHVQLSVVGAIAQLVTYPGISQVLRLEIELVPRALWGLSLAKTLKRSEWDRLRYAAYSDAGHRCEICAGMGAGGPARNPGGLEAHEIWEYEVSGQSGVQRLKRIVALCPSCHKCKHMGRSRKVASPEQFADLKRHFLRVNSIPPWEYDDYLAEVVEVMMFRDSLEWSQDLSVVGLS